MSLLFIEGIIYGLIMMNKGRIGLLGCMRYGCEEEGVMRGSEGLVRVLQKSFMGRG